VQAGERVLVWGNVRRAFESEKVKSILIDDFTSTLNVTAFAEQRHWLEKALEGDRLQVVGEAKADKRGELYILPEIVIKIDCSKELLRRLENLEFFKENKGRNLPEGSLSVESRQL